MNTKKSSLNLYNLLWLLFIYIFLSSCISNNQSNTQSNTQQHYDEEIAAKYELTVPPSNEKIDPAPQWLQNANMITSDHEIWKGYKFTLKDTLLTRIVRRRAGNMPSEITEHYPIETIEYLDGSLIKGVPLISHVPHSRKAFEEAHNQGFKVIPYVHFKDIHTFYADQDVFLFEHPEVLLQDEGGKWVHIPMDGTDRLYRILTCANNPSYWKLSLEYVKKMMDWGADGVFIDNVGKRVECFAPNFNRDEKDPRTNPEFKYYIHEHLFPESTHDYAWDRMLQAIRKMVKSYGEDKVVVLNSGNAEFQKNGDACMWESFIYSWAWEGRNDNHTWDYIKKRAQENKWFLDSGRRITALSTINPARSESKDDAFWAFTAANLVDFIWWATLSGTGAEILYQVQLGKSLAPLKEMNNIAHRFFENGLIVLNNDTKDQKVELEIPTSFQKDFLYDVYEDSQKVQIIENKIVISVPKESARVYTIN